MSSLVYLFVFFKVYKFRFIFFLSLSTVSLTSYCQVFKQFSVKDGAPQPVVLDIAQDKQGLMWFATTNGLYRYDACLYTHFVTDPEDSRSLPHNHVRKIYSDSRGNLWICSYGGLSRYDPGSETFTTFQNEPGNNNSIGENMVLCIVEDAEHNYWVGTENGVNKLTFDQDRISVERFLYTESSDKKQYLKIRSICEGKDGVIWMGTSEGLVRISKDGQKMSRFKTDKAALFPETNVFLAMHQDDSGNLWLGSRKDGLTRFNIAQEKFETVTDFQKPGDNLPGVSTILSDPDGKLWIATVSGLAWYDPVTKKQKWYNIDEKDPRSLQDSSLYALCVDSDGGVWVGSYYFGIQYLNPQSERFNLVPVSAKSGGSFVATWLGRQSEGMIWAISDDRDEVVLFDPVTNDKHLSDIPFPFPLTYRALHMDKDGVVWGANNLLLSRYDPKNGNVQHFPRDTEKKLTGRAFQIMEDSQGKLWLSGSFGLLMFDKDRKTFIKPPGSDGAYSWVGTNFVWSAIEDPHGDIWIGGINKAFVLRKNATRLSEIKLDPQIASSETDHTFCQIRAGSSGRVWFCSLGNGIFYSDPFSNILRKLNMSDIECQGFEIDRSGALWINTGDKLFRLHPEKGTVQQYDAEDGLPYRGAFIVAASTNTADGTLYFGTTKGVFRFHPDSITVNETPRVPLFTTVKLFNKVVEPGKDSTVILHRTDHLNKVEFNYDQNVFSISFSTADYSRSHNKKFAYRLEGFEDNWNYVTYPTASYMNLPPGEYKLRVRVANGDGFWSDEPSGLDIIVHPPFWKTWYAYLFYFLGAFSVVFWGFRYFWLRNSFRKESELQRAKLDFFTNISHELRTHLMLISGPLDKAYASSTLDAETRSYLKYAKSNSNQLLGLIHELLDFRKIHDNKLKLNVMKYDLVQVLEHVLFAFEGVGQEKGIVAIKHFPQHSVWLWFDLTQFQKVLYNLLSNAYKFTQIGGTIEISLVEGAEKTTLSISDNGKGIDPQYLKQIFTNFFQVSEDNTLNTGYGIGLAIAKRIADQHHMDLKVVSNQATNEFPGLTRFSIGIPTGNGHFSESELVAQSNSISVDFDLPTRLPVSFSSLESDNKKCLVLLVEDNDELRAFCREALQRVYRIMEAANGNEGLVIARKFIPDLIICDIMMPGASGLEMCRELKSDILTSHIPVIMLTARGTRDQMIEGLVAGAADYLVKPFDIGVLELKISNLIQMRKSWQNLNVEQVELQESEEQLLSDLDMAFLMNLRGLVESNITNPDFGVNEIAFQVGMSVSVLYRKLRALTGFTVNDFVKSIRMKNAVKLLQAGNHSVTDVSAMVGFESRKYFSREFKKIYGKAPSDFIGVNGPTAKTTDINDS